VGSLAAARVCGTPTTGKAPGVPGGSPGQLRAGRVPGSVSAPRSSTAGATVINALSTDSEPTLPCTRSASPKRSATAEPPSSTQRTLRSAAIPTPERQGRYWIDVARAYHQWGKPGPLLPRAASSRTRRTRRGPLPAGGAVEAVMDAVGMHECPQVTVGSRPQAPRTSR
jgi:hypothetical protein